MEFPLDENLFYSAPSQVLNDRPEDEDGPAYEQPPAEGLLPPADFKSFFTLIEDPQTGAIHHPTVHYIFSDDDAELLTSAALHALDMDGDHLPESHHLELPRERCVIVDVAADGKTVTSASSLSSEWQALKAAVTQAPSLAYTADKLNNGLILTIAGREHTHSISSAAETAPPNARHDIQSLMRDFGERLHSLDVASNGVIETGL